MNNEKTISYFLIPLNFFTGFPNDQRHLFSIYLKKSSYYSKIDLYSLWRKLCI